VWWDRRRRFVLVTTRRRRCRGRRRRKRGGENATIATVEGITLHAAPVAVIRGGGRGGGGEENPPRQSVRSTQHLFLSRVVCVREFCDVGCSHEFFFPKIDDAKRKIFLHFFHVVNKRKICISCTT
jgi:hypothetical protein